MKHNATLLYVEDDLIVRESYSEIFETYFKTVITTDNGNEALTLFESNKIDVAILDISIHGINGLNVAQKIREENQDVIIMMMTAYSDKEKLLQAIDLKLIGYLIKPIKSKELSTMLANISDALQEKNSFALPFNYTFKQVEKSLHFDNVSIKLTNSESTIIKILLNSKSGFMNSCDLHAILYPDKEPKEYTCNNVTQILSRLKKKVMRISHNQDYFIESCYGAGYRILFL